MYMTPRNVMYSLYTCPRSFEAGAETQFQELPAWDVLDRHVLRFSGFFKALGST